MTKTWDTLKDFWQHVRAPKVDDQQRDERLRQLRRDLPTPVFWLLGKAQSGKTSIIRAITGSSRAEIGNGFRPCTRTAELYPFPNETEQFVQFLDTRGIGEVGYDPSEDMQVLEGRAQCVMIVVKALDHAQNAIQQPLEVVLRKHPDWPVIVVQTCLHEAYPAGAKHIQPYPFGELPFPPAVPEDLARSLVMQRQRFSQVAERAQFVAVDFTLPEDGFEPKFYGLDPLWQTIEQAVPYGLRAMMIEEKHRAPLRDLYFHTAHPHVISYSVLAGGVAAVPVPLIDIPLLLGIQAKMFHSLASIYEQPMSPSRMAEIASTLGLGFAARMGARELLKFVPVWGEAVAATFAGASTYALGCTLCTYFSHVRRGDVPDAAKLRELYRQEYEEGRKRLKAYLHQLTSHQERPK